MSAVLARQEERRAAAANLTQLAHAERAAYGAYMSAPAGAENDWSADSPHQVWHRALHAWGVALVAYRARYGDTGDSGTLAGLPSDSAE